MSGRILLGTLLIVAAAASACKGERSKAPAVATLPGAVRAATPAAAPSERVTREELAIFLDHEVEVRDLIRKVQEEMKAAGGPTNYSLEAQKRHQEYGWALIAREPFKNSRKGDAMRAVLSAFYISGSFFRDEKELARLRASYGEHGRELIDSIADQEALFRKKLG